MDVKDDDKFGNMSPDNELASSNPQNNPQMDMNGLNALMQALNQQPKKSVQGVNPDLSQTSSQEQLVNTEQPTIHHSHKNIELANNYRTKYIYHILLICGLALLLVGLIFTVISLYRLISDPDNKSVNTLTFIFVTCLFIFAIALLFIASRFVEKTNKEVKHSEPPQQEGGMPGGGGNPLAALLGGGAG
jgi:hypothetical protein